MRAVHPVASRYRSIFTSGSFGDNVLVMFGGTLLGQMISVLLSPILTRIYTPDMFGTLGLFSAGLSIIAVMASLRYEMALPLVQSDDEAANLLGVCMIALLFTTGISVLVVMLLSVSETDLGAITPYIWLLPVGFFCIGAYQIVLYYATRQSAFSTIARTKIYQGTIGPVVQIALGLAGVGAWGLIVGFIAGQSAGVKLLFTRVISAPRALGNVSVAGMRAMAKRFRRFLMISSWSGIMESVGCGYILLVVMPFLYSTTVAGFIFLTDRIIGRPLLLVSTSILQVYVGDIGKTLTSDPAAVRSRFLQLAGLQLCIVSFWLVLANLLAPYVIPLIFGKEWEGAVPYLHVLSIAYLPQMIVHAMTHTLQMLERQGLSALWEAGRLTALIGAFVVSYTYGLDALHAVLAYSIVQATAQVILFFLMYRSIQSIQKDAPDAKI
jgi:O-antigen/teichoic acid export membrane protein